MAEGGSASLPPDSQRPQQYNTHESFEESSDEPLPLTLSAIRAPTETLDAKSSEIHIVLAGKSGSGKSTLASNILDLEQTKTLSPDHETTKCESKQNEMHSVTIHITDTVGLEGGKEKRKELKKLSKYVKDKGHQVDLLIYCIPVSPSSKFHDANPAIMKSLVSAFGVKIWNHCILILTFSNEAWKWHAEEDRTTRDYEEYIIKCSKRFKEELVKLKVPNVTVEAIFDLQSEATQDPADHDQLEIIPADQEQLALLEKTQTKENKILAIPAGNKPNDLILSHFRPRTCVIQVGAQQIEFAVNDWRDVIFIEIVRKCKEEVKKRLLRYRYGRDIRKVIAQGGTSGALVGAVAGGITGTVLGVAGGPIGIVCGAATGTAVGAVVGGLTGSVVLAKKRLRK